MPTRRSSANITFHTTEGDFNSLDKALLEAAKSSLALGGKYTTVSIYAHTRRAAVDMVGLEAAAMWDISGQEPLARIQVKVGPMTLYR